MPCTLNKNMKINALEKIIINTNLQEIEPSLYENYYFLNFDLSCLIFSSSKKTLRICAIFLLGKCRVLYI